MTEQEKFSRLFGVSVGFMIVLILASIYGGLILSKSYGENVFRAGLLSALVLIFLLVLFLGYKRNPSLNKGEMRRAIAATFVVAFLMLLFFGMTPNEKVLNFFFGVLATVIGFYFGYRKVEERTEEHN